MPIQSKAITTLAPNTLAALEQLGSHLAVARVRRKESMVQRALRIGVTVPTLMKLEQGDPRVSMGAYAQALSLIGRDGELARIAAPEFDLEALDNDVNAAIALGKKRAQAAQRSRVGKANKANK